MITPGENLGPVTLAIFRHQTVSVDELVRRAARVLPPGLATREGKSEFRLRSFYAGRCAAAEVLGHRAISAWVVPNPAYGFLQLADDQLRVVPNWFINISHTDKIAVAVLATVPVGVDVEATARPISRRVLERVSTPRELASLVPGPFPCPPGIRLWSAKEAVSKAVGLGIKFGMKVFEIATRDRGVMPVEISCEGPFEVSNPGVESFIDGEYVISICADRAVLARGVETIIVN